MAPTPFGYSCRASVRFGSGVANFDRVSQLSSNPGGQGRRMNKRMIFGGLVAAAQILGSGGAVAGPWEDGMTAYNRGDYMPAIRLFRPLAEQGNARAQHLIGVMYHKGEGVARNP